MAFSSSKFVVDAACVFREIQAIVHVDAGSADTKVKLRAFLFGRFFSERRNGLEHVAGPRKVGIETAERGGECRLE